MITSVAILVKHEREAAGASKIRSNYPIRTALISFLPFLGLRDYSNSIGNHVSSGARHWS
jgi:hypothetical protein